VTRWLALLLLPPLLSGCVFILRPPVTGGTRVSNDRYEVGRVGRPLLSADQKKVLDQMGTPDAIVFEEELETGKQVQRWVYTPRNEIKTFLAGKEVEYVRVASSGFNPLLDPQQTEQGPLIMAWQFLQLVGHWVRD
jgi:hypothetical protein